MPGLFSFLMCATLVLGVQYGAHNGQTTSLAMVFLNTSPQSGPLGLFSFKYSFQFTPDICLGGVGV